MRYPASEKLEIIRLVERSHLPVRRTWISSAFGNDVLPRYDATGPLAKPARGSYQRSRRVWNRIPDEVRRQIVDLALDEPELSPRELAVTFTTQRATSSRKRAFIAF